MTERRFPPPWSVDDPDKKSQSCYIDDADRHALAYLYLEEEVGTSRGRRDSLNPADEDELVDCCGC
jgi:hypothetical protein